MGPLSYLHNPDLQKARKQKKFWYQGTLQNLTRGDEAGVDHSWPTGEACTCFATAVLGCLILRALHLACWGCFNVWHIHSAGKILDLEWKCACARVSDMPELLLRAATPAVLRKPGSVCQHRQGYRPWALSRATASLGLDQ